MWRYASFPLVYTNFGLQECDTGPISDVQKQRNHLLFCHLCKYCHWRSVTAVRTCMGLLMMKNLLNRFRQESAGNQPSLISRGQSALKGYLRPPPKPDVVEEEDCAKTVLDILDNPDLELEPDGFDPYNSGGFDRNKRWNRVKKTVR